MGTVFELVINAHGNDLLEAVAEQRLAFNHRLLVGYGPDV